MPAPMNMQQSLRYAQHTTLERKGIHPALKVWAIVQLEKQIQKLDQAEIAANKRMHQIIDKLDDAMTVE